MSYSYEYGAGAASSQRTRHLDLGGYLRSRQIARFFFTRKFTLPDQDSEAYSPDLDYQDVKLKIVQQEGYDAHDFNLFDDRSSQLWRKPYVDGAVRELTSGQSRSQEQIRQAVEQMMVASGTANPDVRYTTRRAHRSRGGVTVDAEIDDDEGLLTDIRRNRQDQVPSRPVHIKTPALGRAGVLAHAPSPPSGPLVSPVGGSVGKSRRRTTEQIFARRGLTGGPHIWVGMDQCASTSLPATFGAGGAGSVSGSENGLSKA